MGESRTKGRASGVGWGGSKSLEQPQAIGIPGKLQKGLLGSLPIAKE